MAKRSEAKKARDEAIKAANDKNEYSSNSNFEDDNDQRDIYEVAMANLKWTPSPASERQHLVKPNICRPTVVYTELYL